jgi:hypothetical protein
LKLAILLGGDHQVSWLADSERRPGRSVRADVPDLVLVNVGLPSVDWARGDAAAWCATRAARCS